MALPNTVRSRARFALKNKVPQKWHGRRQLVRLSLRGGLDNYIAEGNKKRVYAGFAFFKQLHEGKIKIVKKPIAIKTFKETMSYKDAKAYNGLIASLREKGYPLPKGRLVKVTKDMSEALQGIAKPGEWIALQQFFGKDSSSKIIDRRRESLLMMEKLKRNDVSLSSHSDVSLLFYGKKMARSDAASLFGQLANFGASPKFDVIAPLKGKNGIRSAIPFDFDLVLDELTNRSSKPPKPALAIELLHTLRLMTNNSRERERLFRIAVAQIKDPKLSDYVKFYKKGIFEKKFDETFSFTSQ